MTFRKIIAGVLSLAGGQVLSYGISFLRNLMMARMLSKADFGLASIFVLSVGMLEFSSQMGLDRQVVQNSVGDTPKFIKTAHVFQLFSGLVSCIFLLVLSLPLSYLFKVPDKLLGFVLISIIPVLNGLRNLDVVRRQRSLDFLPMVWTEVVPQAVATAIAYPTIKMLSGYHAVLVLIFSKTIMTLLMTHLLSVNRYSLGWDKKLAKSMWHFGWPLILNGLLIYASQKGDRLLVGSCLSLELLGLYSICTMLIDAPYMIMAQAYTKIHLPIISRVQNDAIQFNKNFDISLEISAVAAVVGLLPLIVGGEHILILFTKGKYTGGGIVIAILAAASVLRFIRIPTGNAAMAKGNTKFNLYVNMFRSSSLIFGLLAMFAGGSILALSVSVLLGELVSLTGVGWLVKKRMDISIAGLVRTSIYTLICLYFAGTLVVLGANTWGYVKLIFTCLSLIVVCVVFARFIFNETAESFLMLIHSKLQA